MFFVIFWTALVRYTWLSNSSRFFFPTISTFGCFWSQWPTSLAVTSGREGVRTTSFKPWRPHRGSCRGATAIEENNGSRRERCGAGGCRREATWIYIYINIIIYHYTIYNVKWDSIYIYIVWIMWIMCVRVCMHNGILWYTNQHYHHHHQQQQQHFNDRSTGIYVHIDWNIQHYLTKNIALGLLVCSLAIKLGNGKFPN